MANAETPKIENPEAACCLKMESVDRIGKLPVVESTIETANNIYGKIKVIYLFAFSCRANRKQIHAKKILFITTKYCLLFLTIIKHLLQIKVHANNSSIPLMMHLLNTENFGDN